MSKDENLLSRLKSAAKRGRKNHATTNENEMETGTKWTNEPGPSRKFGWGIDDFIPKPRLKSTNEHVRHPIGSDDEQEVQQIPEIGSDDNTMDDDVTNFDDIKAAPHVLVEESTYHELEAGRLLSGGGSSSSFGDDIDITILTNALVPEGEIQQKMNNDVWTMASLLQDISSKTH